MSLNAATIILAERRTEYFSPDSWRVFFARVHAELKHLAPKGPQLLAVAVDSVAQTVSSASVVCSDEQPAVLVVGRHSEADLSLPDEPEMALRHLLLFHSRCGATSDLMVLDLRTQTGFRDEWEQAQQAISSDGAAMVRIGRYLIYIFVTPEPALKLKSADAAWQALPRRARPAASPSEELGGELSLQQLPHPYREQGARAPAPGNTTITSLPSATFCQRKLLGSREVPVATVELQLLGRQITIPVGQRALRRGILVGRYERCALLGKNLQELNKISRVHLLLLQVNGRRYAIDTASTNGTYLGGEDEQQPLIPLEQPTRLRLGNSVRIRWIPEAGE